MTEKIDLRKKGNGIIPPDIAALIRERGNAYRAEKYAGLGSGVFGKIQRGEKNYSNNTKLRVEAALAGNPIPREKVMPPLDRIQTNLNTADACPPILTELIKYVGSKAKAIKVLGTSEGTFYAVINGKKPMPPTWGTRSKAHMGVPVIGPREDLPEPPPQDQGPPFVPWDNKALKSVTLRPMAGKKGRTIKMPPTFADLITMYGGNLSQTAASMGHTSGALTSILKDPKKFSEKWQRKVHAALNGLAPIEEINQDYDRYTMGFAMVLASGQINIDRIMDISEIMNGNMFYKKNTKTGWWLFIKMATDDLPKFKKLASRDAQEIVCP